MINLYEEGCMPACNTVVVICAFPISKCAKLEGSQSFVSNNHFGLYGIKDVDSFFFFFWDNDVHINVLMYLFFFFFG